MDLASLLQSISTPVMGKNSGKGPNMPRPEDFADCLLSIKDPGRQIDFVQSIRQLFAQNTSAAFGESNPGPDIMPSETLTGQDWTLLMQLLAQPLEMGGGVPVDAQASVMGAVSGHSDLLSRLDAYFSAATEAGPDPLADNAARFADNTGWVPDHSASVMPNPEDIVSKSGPDQTRMQVLPHANGAPTQAQDVSTVVSTGEDPENPSDKAGTPSGTTDSLNRRESANGFSPADAQRTIQAALSTERQDEVGGKKDAVKPAAMPSESTAVKTTELSDVAADSDAHDHFQGKRDARTFTQPEKWVAAKADSAEKDAPSFDSLRTATASSASSGEKPSAPLTSPSTAQAAGDNGFQRTIMDQIVEKAMVRASEGRSEMRIQLKPEVLGNVRMQIVSEDHHVAVRMITDHSTTRDIIESQLHHLKAELDRQGLVVDKIEVMVNTNTDQHHSREQFFQMFRNPASAANKDGGGGSRQQQPEDQARDRRRQDASTNESKREGISYFA